jgi:hypothetical protein
MRLSIRPNKESEFGKESVERMRTRREELPEDADERIEKAKPAKTVQKTISKTVKQTRFGDQICASTTELEVQFANSVE